MPNMTRLQETIIDIPMRSTVSTDSILPTLLLWNFSGNDVTCNLIFTLLCLPLVYYGITSCVVALVIPLLYIGARGTEGGRVVIAVEGLVN